MCARGVERAVDVLDFYSLYWFLLYPTFKIMCSVFSKLSVCEMCIKMKLPIMKKNNKTLPEDRDNETSVGTLNVPIVRKSNFSQFEE